MGAESRPLTYDEYRTRKYVPELDGLRALSILLVIKTHVSPPFLTWLAGYVGVVLFFVLSGYLITTLALREEEASGRVSLSAFYIRRCFRIFPLYYFTIGLYCLLILGLDFKPAGREALLGTLPAYLLYFPEVPIGFGWYRDVPFTQAWSLGIEEKFYLVWPFLAFVWWLRRPRQRWRGTVILLVVFASSNVLNYMERPGLAFCLAPYTHILFGCLLAQALHDRRCYEHLRRLVTGRATALVLVLYATAHLASAPLFGAGHGAIADVLYGAAATLLVACVLVGRGKLQGVLSWRPLVFVGTLSYGMYLIHFFALYPVQHALGTLPAGVIRGAASFAGGAALSVLAAYILAITIERPLIRMGRRLSERVARRSGMKGVDITGAPRFPIDPEATSA